MDASRLSQGDLIAGGSGLALFLFLFLDWFGAGGFSANGWETFDIIDVLLAIIGLGTLGLVAARAGGVAVNLPAPPGAILALAGYTAAIMVLTVLLEGDDTKVGVWLALLAAIGILFGGWQAIRAPRAGRTAPPPGPPPAA